MNKWTLKQCGICFTSDNSINIMETSLYKDFFIQMVTTKDMPKEMYLCVWCKAILKKTIHFIDMVKESQRISQEVDKEEPTKLKLFEMSYHYDYIDIPPNIDENNPVIHSKTENENFLKSHSIENLYLDEMEFDDNTDSNSNDKYETESKQLEIDTIDVSYVHDKKRCLYKEMQDKSYVPKIDLKSTLIQVEGNGNISKEKKRCLYKEVEDKNYEPIPESKTTLTAIEGDGNIDSKQEKMRRLCTELKFEVKYLSKEEMRQDIRDKKGSDKYKNMAFNCSDCGIGFLTNDVFQEHNRRHGEIAGHHKCDICNLHFKSADVLSQHILAHKRRFSCVLCSTVFNRWSHCIAHRHKCGMPQTNVVCEDCNKLFSDNYSLNVHVKGVHKRERKYACTQCEKAFISKQRLTIHTRSHTGQKPFACDNCNRKFASNSNLRSHKIVHVNTKKHYCVECNTYYKSGKSLKRHFSESSRHAKRVVLSCPECPKRFTSERALNSHVNTKHLKQPVYSCHLCIKTFSNGGNLKKHVRCVHEAANEINN